MTDTANRLKKRRRKARPRQPNPRVYRCPCCKEEVAFVWKCPCGFRICQTCMDENTWGMTCNHVTWDCPDCGQNRSY